jgi:hypothetical protein
VLFRNRRSSGALLLDAFLDELDGRIDNAFYDRMSAQWRVEQSRLPREIERHSEAEESYMEESYMEDGLRLLDLARNAGQLFTRQAPKKNRLLNLVLSNCEWHQGEVRAAFRQPFDSLAETTTSAVMDEARGTNLSAGPIRLGWGTWIRTRTNGVRVPAGSLIIKLFFPDFWENAACQINALQANCRLSRSAFRNGKARRSRLLLLG